MPLDDLLNQEIQANLSNSEKLFYGMSDDLAGQQKLVKEKFSSKAFQIMTAVLRDAENSEIVDLEYKINRLAKLDKYIDSASIGDEEKDVLRESSTKIRAVLHKQLANQKTLFTRTKKMISDHTVDVGALLIGISGGDPLLALGVKLGGDYLKGKREKKIQEASNRRSTIRADAESLTQQNLKKSSFMGGMGGMDMGGFDMGGFDMDSMGGMGGMAGFGGGGMGGFGDNSSGLQTIMQDIFITTEKISADLKKVANIMQSQNADGKFDSLSSVETDTEMSRDGLVRAKDSDKENTKKGIIASTKELLGQGAAGGRLLMMVGKYGFIAGTAGTVLYGAYDIIQSYLKTGGFGESGIEKLVRGIDDQLIGALGILGGGAKDGAAAGSNVLPLGGTLFGGLFGAMLESLTGWLGDAVPDMGATNPFQAGLFGIFDILMSSVNGMFKSIFNMAENAISFLPAGRETAMSQLNKVRGSFLSGTESLSASLTTDNRSAVNKQYDNQMDQLNRDFKTGTGEFKEETGILSPKVETNENKQIRFENRKKILESQRSKTLQVANKMDQKRPSPSFSPKSQAPSNTSTSATISGDRGKAILLEAMDKAGIIDTAERAQFMAQMSHESMGYTRLEEMASGENYEGRKSLGNTEPGDGKRFKGRGFVQLTGRSNYEIFGNKIGLDLINNPEWAADPKVAADCAIAYWTSRVKPKVSNFNDIKATTKAINGGLNGLADRNKKFSANLSDPSIAFNGGSVPSNTSTSLASLGSSGATAAPSTGSIQMANAQSATQSALASQSPGNTIINAPNNTVVNGRSGGQSGGPQNAVNIGTTSVGGSATRAMS